MAAIYILIPLLPLLASIVIVMAARRWGESVRKIGTIAIGASFGLSVVALVQLAATGRPITIPLYQFLKSGDLAIDFDLYVDQLSALVLLLVTGVSFVVHAYSSRYMIGDARHGRFFALMSLFTFAMVTLVMSSNLLLTFICWELMGICSYLLISHQSDRRSACNAATKAFLVNAVADAGLLFALVLTFATFGTLDIQQIISLTTAVGGPLGEMPFDSGQAINLLAWFGGDLKIETVTLIVLFLFVGCMGKSAQIPFHVWLPEAMEAPTPVSALIHAATMVNAGPFLLIRLSPLVMLSPSAMVVIALVGGTTALFAGVVSLVQADIKKSLAYSTISQIGFMIMTCGLGAFVAAVFHLLAHGVLKGYLFLSSGSQLESLSAHAPNDATADRNKLSWSLRAGALGLACVTPVLLFSGPYQQLWTSHHSVASEIGFIVLGMLSVFFAAVYCVRHVATLFQPSSSQVGQPRFYSAFHVTVISAGLLVLGGGLLILWHFFVPFLMPALAEPYPPVTDNWTPIGGGALFLISLLVAGFGWAMACVLPAKFSAFALLPASIRRRLYVLILNKFYFDELSDVLIVRPSIRFARWVCRVVDVGVVDGIIVQCGRLVFGAAIWIWRTVDVRGMQHSDVNREHQPVGIMQRLSAYFAIRPYADASTRKQSDPSNEGADLGNVAARPLQHQLLIQILWLIVAITFFYWLVLSP